MANHPNRSKSKIAKTQEALKPGLDAIIAAGGRCMEQVLDRENGIVVERWVFSNGRSVIAYGTPLWREFFEIIAPESNTWEATIEGLKRVAGVDPSAPAPEVNVEKLQSDLKAARELLATVDTEVATLLPRLTERFAGNLRLLRQRIAEVLGTNRS
jgi:hypothetical protein